MRKLYFYLLPLVLLIINLTACAQQGERHSMTVSELRDKLNDKDSNFVLLDVRTDEELTGPLGHIDGIIHIPLQELKQRITELSKYNDKEIAVICRSGNRSNTATGFLRMNGFDAVNVEGGMTEYRRTEQK